MIGRVYEKEYLNSLLEEEESQFVAVVGRRRVGKTYLVRESFNYKFTFEHAGISNCSIKGISQKQAQLDKFSDSLQKAGYNCSKKLKSWTEAFKGLEDVINNAPKGKKVIFIDELSWMDTKGSGMISALESFWNSFVLSRSEKDVILIVCASATYWMVDNIINAKGGLHNRLTGKIFLKPFTLKECEQYLLGKKIVYNRYQILKLYMIMGGIPYYLNFLKKNKSFSQNIDDIFFKDNAFLYDEYNNLYSSLFNKPDLYLKIIDLLCKVNKGLTRDEICNGLKVESSGEITKKLLELENCGFIRKYIPFNGKKNKCIYQLIDNYIIFYNKFLKDKPYDEFFWEKQSNSPAVISWCGIAFERVCLEHIYQIKEALKIGGVYSLAHTWQCKKNEELGIEGSQINLLIARKDQIINVCEMKYSESEYVIDSKFDLSMRRKIADFVKITKTKYAIHKTLITTYGVVNNSFKNDMQAIITMNDLFI